MLKQLLTGIALFLSIYYVISFNSQILSNENVGVPAQLSVFGTLTILFFGNITGAWLTRTGLLIAPAVGISAFFAAYVSKTSLTWQEALFSCVIAGIAFFLFSLNSENRKGLIESLPHPVRMGAKASIGSLLTFTGLDVLQNAISDNASEQIVYIGAFISFFIFISFSLARRAIDSFSIGPKTKFLLHTIFRTEFLISVVIMTMMLSKFLPGYMNSLNVINSASLPFFDVVPIIFPLSFESFALSMVLSVVVFMILITDIPGTPPEVLPESPDRNTKWNKDDATRRGFLNDSIFSFFSPMFGTTPSIYYAENLITKEESVFGRAVAFPTIFASGVLLFFLLFSEYLGIGPIDINQILPPAAVAPIIIYVGIVVIAISFLGAEDSKETRQDEVDTPIHFYFPTAIAVILTPRIGIEMSFPLSILVFWFAHWFSGREKPKLQFVYLSIASAIIVVVYTALWLLD